MLLTQLISGSSLIASFMKTPKIVLLIPKHLILSVGVIMLIQMDTTYRLHSPTTTRYLLQFSVQNNDDDAVT